MSCIGFTSDVLRRWFRRLNDLFCNHNNHVQDEIVRKLLVELLKPIDEAYGVEPLSVDEIKAQLDKYIERKVNEKIAELKQFCRQVQAGQTIPDPSTEGAAPGKRCPDQNASGEGSGEGPTCSSSDIHIGQETPQNDDSTDIPQGTGSGTEAEVNTPKKKKSLLKKILKLRPKHRHDDTSEAAPKKRNKLLRKVFKKLPIIQMKK